MIPKLNEVAPPGWGHTKAEKEKTKPNKPKSKIGGTAHAMQKAQKRGDIPKDMNIFALMWSMKNKGDKPHYKPGVKGKLKGKYKGPEGQNEMIDPKKIRNYKNVPNSVVAKADKEAEKVKDKEQKGTLEFPQMPTEESKWSKNFKDQGAKRRGEAKRRQQAQQHSPGQRVPPKTKNYGEDVDESLWVGDDHKKPKPSGKQRFKKRKGNKPAHKPPPPTAPKLKGGTKKGPTAKVATKSGAMSVGGQTGSSSSGAVAPLSMDMSLAPKGKGKKAAKALYQGEDIDMVSLVAQAMNKLAEGEWADEKRKEKESSDRLIAIHNEREKRYQAQQAAKKKAGAKKEEVEIDELTQAEYDSGGLVRKHLDRKQASGTSRETENKIAHNKRVQMRKRLEKAADERDKKEGIEGDALVKAVANSSKQQALKKKQMLSITPAGKRAEKKGDNKLSITAKGRAAIGEDIPTPKFKPLRHKVWSADASIPSGARPKNPGKIKKYKASGAMPETISHFGDQLRQAIEEAKKVNAIDTINKIVKTKTMGKLHGQRVDLFTASAIQQVYNALNKKNQEKMVSVMSKDVHGLLKMADFSMKQMKR